MWSEGREIFKQAAAFLTKDINREAPGFLKSTFRGP